MMPLPVRRKARDMEKVENLCRTATAQQIFANTVEHIGSRLRDSADAGGADATETESTRRSLPKISDFAVEFYECCAAGRRLLNAGLKFGCFRASFLRCSVTRFRVPRSHQRESWICAFTTFARR
jgi:hypothetical protein